MVQYYINVKPLLLFTSLLVFSACGVTTVKAPLSLSQAKELYEKDTENYEKAVAYAQKLLSENHTLKAKSVLEPMKTQELQKPAFFIALSNIESRIGLHGKAIQYAKQATELAPESKEATLQLSKIYDRAGKKEKAIEAFEKAINLSETPEPHMLNTMAIMKADTEDYAGAVLLLQEASKLAPKNREIERNLRITMALFQSYSVTAPKPKTKPKKSKEKEKAESKTKEKVETRAKKHANTQKEN